MVNKCIAPGCRTGYTAESNHIKISCMSLSRRERVKTTMDTESSMPKLDSDKKFSTV